VFAQQPRITANRDLQSGAQAGHQQRVISQDEVRRDLQQAGYNNIEFLESAYVVRATNKDRTKLVMTITPQDVRAIQVSPIGQMLTPHKVQSRERQIQVLG
jgi:hypothetical protein